MSANAFLERLKTIDNGLLELARLRLHSPLPRVLIGIAIAVVSLGLRAALEPVYDGVAGFIMFVPGVILASLAGGWVSGVSALSTSLAFGVAMLILTGDARTALSAHVLLISALNFALVGLFSVLTGASLRRTLYRLDSSLHQLQESHDRITRTEDQLDILSHISPAHLWIVEDTEESRLFGSAQHHFWDGDEGQSHYDLAARVHPDDRARVLTIARDATTARRPFEVEARHRADDGSWRYVHTYARPRIDADGRYRGMIGVNVDVTEARQADQILRESESRFRQLADTAPAPVWMSNSDGDITFGNEALAQFLGLTECENIPARIWRDAVHPDDLSAFEALRAASRAQHVMFESDVRFRRGDGAWRWMRLVIKPRYSKTDDFTGYLGMAVDNTAAREASDALLRQERRQTFILELLDRLRDLSDPETIMSETARSVGELLGVQRVGYGEVDHSSQHLTMWPGWNNGVPPFEGRMDLASYSDHLMYGGTDSQAVRIDDIEAHPCSPPLRALFDRLETRALMRAPLLRAGRIQAFLYAHTSSPRIWTESEASLLVEVATRAWGQVERARAEAKLRESEQRFRAIADTAPVLIWVTGPNEERTFVNRAYVDFCGMAYEEAVQTRWFSRLHPDDRHRVHTERQDGSDASRPYSVEARFQRHDGEWRWLKSFIRPRTSGSEVIGYVGVAFDVTETRIASALLSESESRLRTVADTAPAFIWMIDESARLTFANNRYRAFFSTSGSADADEDLSENWQKLLAPEDLKAFVTAYSRAVETHDRFDTMSRVQHPVLGQRWLRTEAVPRFDSAGTFLGYVGVSLDITEAKQTEDALKLLNEQLEDRVEAALDEKAQAEAHLLHAQRLEAVGRLTGGVAHDFNNLLTVVIGALDIILRSDDPVKRRKLAEAALAAARRGENLTHQLLAFSRRQALRPEPVDLNALIRECDPLLRRAVGEAVTFQVRLKRGAARVHVDPAQFEAALLNLIVNARDALGDMAGQTLHEDARITVETQNHTFAAGEVPELEPGRYVCVCVTDNGPGMSPEVIDQVFEPFFTTKPVGKGTGLGLSQVYGFVHQSGGAVAVQSSLGEGTEIRLYLPLLAPTRSRKQAPAPAITAAKAPQDRKLLLVEDDAGVAAVAIELLQELGLQVRLAQNGPEALKLLQTERFELMITDTVMPGGINGVELARQAQRDWPEMRIILTSGYVGEDVNQVLRGAPWPFLRKPYSADRLRALIEDATALPPPPGA